MLVEALAAGKPVVATAFPHAIELSATGAVIVVDHGSLDGIASAVTAILTDQSIRATMQAAARVESARYDWPIVGERFRRLMTGQLRQRSAAWPARQLREMTGGRHDRP